jgi:hypothetical protein
MAGLLTALLLPRDADAQESSTTQLWLDLVAEWAFKPKNQLELEVGPKYLISDDERWKELTVTPAYEHYPNQRWDLVARVLFSWVQQSDALSTFEIRPVVGFKIYLTRQDGRWMSRDFNRVEGRNIRYNELDQWETTYRYRNRLEVQYALNNPSITDDHTWYGLADAELFVNLGEAAEERFNDNWRFRAGMGYRQEWGWRIELLYTLQLTRNTLGQEFNVSNHIVRLRIKHYFHSF